MAPATLRQRIEELRSQLHRGMASAYNPARMQDLAPISEELDRLVVEYTQLIAQPAAGAAPVSGEATPDETEEAPADGTVEKPAAL